MNKAIISPHAATECDTEDYDVVIVGAGPAGTSAGLRLARSGARVALFERRKFPRHKLCGEFLSPECLPHFRVLGVETDIDDARPARITETVFYTVGGRRMTVPSGWFGGGASSSDHPAAAIGISRREMDARLLKRAATIGVRVHEETRVTQLIQTADGAIGGVRFERADGSVGEARARVTIDATGRARVLTRILARMAERSAVAPFDPQPTPGRAHLVAFKAHFVGARGLVIDKLPTHLEAADAGHASRCEIYFYEGGYGGLNRVEGEVDNLCFIVRADAVRGAGGDGDRIMRDVVCRNERARGALAAAERVTEWTTTALESFGRRRPAPAPGLLAAGDAAAFIDPFTGSGMLMALEGGQIAAETIAAWLAADSDAASAANLSAAYAAAYERRFDARLRLCGALRRAAFAPASVIEVAISLLGASDNLRRFVARSTRRR